MLALAPVVHNKPSQAINASAMRHVYYSSNDAVEALEKLEPYDPRDPTDRMLSAVPGRLILSAAAVDGRPRDAGRRLPVVDGRGASYFRR